MGFLDTTSKILNTTARVLNEAAFGDIRNIFNNGGLYDFRMRPIGLYKKSYWFMLNHIRRNIGNSEYVYDGYSTPIGEMCNPFYNTIVREPWFLLDTYKNATANYLDYIRYTYGATISVENINTNNLFHISEDASAVGYIEGEYAIEALVNETVFIPNNNGTGMDTYMGIESGYYNRETLRNAVVANDMRRLFGNGISKDSNDYVGITTENIVKNKRYASRVDKSTGRFADEVFNPLYGLDSPVEDSNYGHYSDIGTYYDFYDSLGEKSKIYYEKNVYADGKIYYPSIRGGNSDLKNGKTYLGRIGVSVGHDNLLSKESNSLDAVAIDELQIRYVFRTLEEHSNISDAINGGVYIYAEKEKNSDTNIVSGSFNLGTKFSRYTSYGSLLTSKDLLYKTNESFKNGNYKTIIARFHTDSSEADITDTTQTAITKKYGLSHGRNLLKTNPDDSAGYENPYCRVWTFHHQYHSLSDTIRPLPYDADELYGQYNFSTFTADHSQKGFENGRKRLEKFGSLNKNNGLVNITPIDNNDESKKVDIRNCMFSIENLAWKDVFSTDAKSRETFQAGGLSSEQKGPFGGRIMWFPPYDLKFSENVNVNWNENSFIGRGENIYTYTNTVRGGNLSFKILVDHPSIINYWENRGKISSDSVDDVDVDDPEQQLLRFFAGCDMLTGSPSPEPQPDVIVKDEPIPISDTIVLKFFVFYPNNYSGIDDDVDFAMKYLVNGIGAGKENNGHEDYRIPFANEVNGYGGYEMRPGFPISTNSAVTSQNNETLFIANTKIGTKEVNIYGQEGDSTNVWWQRKWYYRIDNAYKNQKLKKESYIDMDSFGLNSSLGQKEVIENFGIIDTDNLYSFADVYVALEGGESRNVLSGFYDENKVNDFLGKIEQYKEIEYVECIGKASVQGHSNLNKKLQINRAKTIQKWLLTKQEFDTAEIVCLTGGTGGEGAGINNGNESSKSNKIWRCAEINIHLKNSVSKTIQSAEKEKTYHQVNTPQNTVEGYANMGVGDIRSFNDLSANKLIEEREIKERNTSVRLNHLSDAINGLALNLKGNIDSRNLNVNSVFNSIAEFSEHDKFFQYDNFGNITNVARGKDSFDISYEEMHDNASQDEVAGLYNSVQDKVDNESINLVNNNKVSRYDNESKFFSLLEKEEPFLHHKISDKIKYFDPAFHSISPEGFNARLTFLQQCTRQGPTVGNSDIYTDNTTANNLSFGRPPVCILRIGDFYYTKILIESMTFSFDPLVWDLNTEGIGVMPMIANIEMNFKFIGGSSLAGHIARLQNALSFNYYANTEVYDDRSELAQYDENGNIERLGTQNLTN